MGIHEYTGCTWVYRFYIGVKGTQSIQDILGYTGYTGYS